jgi:hypothetical protein
MNRLATTLVLSALLGFAAQAQAVIPNDSPSQPDLIVGGYTPALADAPVIQDAKNFVEAHLPSLSQVSVCMAYTQVVHGLNIKLIGSGIEEGRQVSWKFVVYKHLDGQMELSLAERL